MTPRATETLKLTLLDGKEYEFLASAGTLYRVKRAMGLNTHKEMWDKEVVEVAIPLFWESLLDKPEGMTMDTFMDLLPANMQANLGKLLEVSMPDPKDRPTSASKPKALKAV